MSLVVRNPRGVYYRRPGNGNGTEQRIARLPVDVHSNDDELIVVATVSGVDPESIELTVEDDILTIKGEVPARSEDLDYILSERFEGAFARSLRLNVPVLVDEIDAHYENGILTVTLPKAEEARPKVIQINAN